MKFFGLWGPLLLLWWSPPLKAVAADNLTHAVARRRSAQIAEVTYHLNLHFDRGAKQMRGQVLIGFRAQRTDQDLVLDFAGRVVQLNINDVTCTPPEDQREHASLLLPASHLRPGLNQVLVTFETPYTNTGVGLHHFIDAEDGREYLYTDLQPNNAHRVFPCFDQPDLRAVFNLELTLPADWEVNTNAPPRRFVRLDGHNRITFAPTKPIATYLFNLVLGQYAAFIDATGPVPQRLLARQSLARYVNDELIFQATAQGMAFFETYFQEPYPFPKYDQAFVPEYNAGAMENPGSVVMNENLILGFAPEPGDIVFRNQVIYHELAHMWFGNLVTLRWWDDLWLNESFASYMEIIALDGMGEEDAWRIAVREKIRAYEADLAGNTRAVVTPVPDVKTASAMFDGIVYNKGMAVLRQLDFYLGEQRFRDGVRTYLDRHAWRNTGLTDFVSAMESVTDQDLDPWFQDWLQTAGLNRVSVTWHARRGRIRKPQLIQERGNSGGPRGHAMELGLFDLDDNGVAVPRRIITIRYHQAVTPLPQLKGERAPLFILPNLKGYDFVDVRLDPVSLAWLKLNLSKVADPGYRVQILEIMWRMVGEGNFPPIQFFDLALTEVRQARDYDTILRLTGYMTTLALETRASPAITRHFSDHLFKLAKSKLLVRRPGGREPWLLWLDLLCESAQQEAHQKYLDDLLTGEVQLKYYPIEIEDQWRLVSALIERGYPTAGARFAAVCNASPPGMLDEFRDAAAALAPDPAVKAKIWQDILSENTISLKRKRRLMQAFHSPLAPQVTGNYTRAYFDQLQTLYQTRPWPFTRAFGSMMFPRYGGEPAMSAARAFLKDPNLPMALRNLVQSGLDQLEKAARIRAATPSTKTLGRRQP